MSVPKVYFENLFFHFQTSLSKSSNSAFVMYVFFDDSSPIVADIAVMSQMKTKGNFITGDIGTVVFSSP